MLAVPLAVNLAAESVSAAAVTVGEQQNVGVSEVVMGSAPQKQTATMTTGAFGKGKVRMCAIEHVNAMFSGRLGKPKTHPL